MENKLSVSFVMPMFNEKDNIEAAINNARAVADELKCAYEIVVVDDASTDTSGEIVDKMARDDGRIRFFRLDANTMFGGAFAEGFRRASGDVILYMDADMPVSMEDIKKSFPLISEADIVTGYSMVRKGDTLRRKIISRVYNMMVRGLFGLNVKDINSGYKIVRRELIKDLDFVSLSPFIDVELFLHARRKNARVKQYPLIFCPRTGGRSYIASIPIIWATFRDMIKVLFKDKLSGIKRALSRPR